MKKCSLCVDLADGRSTWLFFFFSILSFFFAGDLFRDHPKDLKGDNDLLVLTRPQYIKQIHLDMLAAGADFVETNTFNGTSLAQADYGMEHMVYEINKRAAELAKEACAEMSTPDKPRFVFGAVGLLIHWWCCAIL